MVRVTALRRGTQKLSACFKATVPDPVMVVEPEEAVDDAMIPLVP
jgi:hypothetical protein